MVDDEGATRVMGGEVVSDVFGATGVETGSDEGIGSDSGSSVGEVERSTSSRGISDMERDISKTKAGSPISSGDDGASFVSRRAEVPGGLITKGRYITSSSVSSGHKVVESLAEVELAMRDEWDWQHQEQAS